MFAYHNSKIKTKAPYNIETRNVIDAIANGIRAEYTDAFNDLICGLEQKDDRMIEESIKKMSLIYDKFENLKKMNAIDITESITEGICFENGGND